MTITSNVMPHTNVSFTIDSDIVSLAQMQVKCIFAVAKFL